MNARTFPAGYRRTGDYVWLEPKTYIATRDHPVAGPLLKVGSSDDPQRRVKELGATLHVVLPYWCERDLHSYLRRKRVWRSEANYTFVARRLEPVFPAHTEWFYVDLTLGEWIRTYIAFVRATEALLA